MPMTQKTLLERLITDRVLSATVGTFSRTTERIAETLAEELLREPEFREQMRRLVRTAFTKALSDLQTEAPDDETRGTR